MRHRRRSRVLGRAPSHRKALLRNLASALFLTERDAEFDPNPPKVKGRIITTLQKAKEVRPLVEKCITIARHSIKAGKEADPFATDAERGSEQWRSWRKGDDWKKWVAARAPVVAAQRRVLQLIGNKQAMRVLFDDIALRFADRSGGYTRVLRLAKPRLGDAGIRAILEFVGTHERVVVKSEKPSFTDEEETEGEQGQLHETTAMDEAPEGKSPEDEPTIPVEALSEESADDQDDAVEEKKKD